MGTSVWVMGEVPGPQRPLGTLALHTHTHSPSHGASRQPAPLGSGTQEQGWHATGKPCIHVSDTWPCGLWLLMHTTAPPSSQGCLKAVVVVPGAFSLPGASRWSPQYCSAQSQPWYQGRGHELGSRGLREEPTSPMAQESHLQPHHCCTLPKNIKKGNFQGC